MNTMLLQYGDMEDLSDISNSLKFSEKEFYFDILAKNVFEIFAAMP